MITNKEKQDIIDKKLAAILSIINNLQYGIENYEWNPAKGSDTRQIELSEYILQKQALEQEKIVLNN